MKFYFSFTPPLDKVPVQNRISRDDNTFELRSHQKIPSLKVEKIKRIILLTVLLLGSFCIIKLFFTFFYYIAMIVCLILIAILLVCRLYFCTFYVTAILKDYLEEVYKTLKVEKTEKTLTIKSQNLFNKKNDSLDTYPLDDIDYFFYTQLSSEEIIENFEQYIDYIDVKSTFKDKKQLKQIVQNRIKKNKPVELYFLSMFCKGNKINFFKLYSAQEGEYIENELNSFSGKTKPATLN